MDQVKIGNFLKKLRKERSLTQEQLAEHFNISNRTVSRWENGNNMPDISILVELSEFYEVDIREIINGARKSEDTNMDEIMKDTLVKVAEYTAVEKAKFSKELLSDSIVSLVCIIGVLVSLFLTDIGKSTYDGAIIFSCVALGAIISAIKNIMLINGKISKKANIRITKAALVVGIPVIMLSILLILVLVFID